MQGFASLLVALCVTPHASATPTPAPSPAQVKALGELQKEADAYEKAARDYRGVLTRIVQHHYEDRRRRVLAALDAELAIEKRGLRDAREEAIRRLEAFVGANSGPNAQPEKTPDAMFRLGALYEERAREGTDASDDLDKALAPAIAIYRRILAEFPAYRELAGVHYYLGHAYNDSGHAAEAQRVFRAVVCQNRYPYPAASGKLPQDHDRAFWQEFSARKKGRSEDDTFKNPYPDDCRPIAQVTPAGKDPRYLAEVWWLIGDHHFNEADPAGGPYNLNRAEAAYRQSLRYKTPPVHGVAMYKLAWTLFKQQRYESSVQAFVELLRYADEQERLTGDTGADFRAEAYTYIAGSLTYLDFKGPATEEPYASRSDVLDTETDPRAAAQKMRVGIDRVQDGKLIPQDRRWSVEIYKALAQEYRELGQHHNVIDVSELILKKWPLHREAPTVQNEVAESWDRIAQASREGTRERAEAAERALAARTRLSAYVGVTEWTEAHKDDAEALLTAERLARGGLRRAAADHTNSGNALLEKALAISDKASRDPVLENALAEYRLAAQAWGGLPEKDDVADLYDRRYWLADAHHQVLRILVALDRSPSASEVEAAHRTAVAARDSNEDDKLLQPAAQMVVDVAQLVLQDRYNAFARSGGHEGFARRDRVETSGIRIVSEPMPREVLGAIAAREEYVSRVPREKDVGNAPLYRYQAAEYHFLYGQTDESTKRFSALYKEECKKTPYGFMAWRRLLDTAALTGDGKRVRELGQAALDSPCAVGDGDPAVERRVANEALGAADYGDAKTAFEHAQKLPEGPERIAAYRTAGALYRATLEKSPDGDAAPEAAINGAYAYKQAGDYDQAIALYQLFIQAYGSEEKLSRLEKGDASVSPPRPPDPAKYTERVGYLTRARRALAEAYVALFDYGRAADAFDAIATSGRLPSDARRNAARNAVVLHENAGDRARMARAREVFLSLNPQPEQKAEIDWLVASSKLEAWDERGRDENGNHAARLEAIAAMDAYHQANKGDPAAAAYVVRAAYQAAKLRRAGGDARANEWSRNTVAAFERLRAAAPAEGGRSKALGTPEADMAAESAYALLDQRIKADLDPRRPYEGTIDKAVAAYHADLKKAEAYHKELGDIVDRYESPAWSVAARARQGSLYDDCRTNLYFARAPGLKLFTPKEEKLLEQLARVDPERADAYRQKRQEDWRTVRERELAEADRVMVKRYAEAVLLARALKVRNQAVDAAMSRLSLFTGLLGDARMREHTASVVDPATKTPFVYEDGYFLRKRPGMSLDATAEVTPPPLPSAR